jgi:hypothetical protein
MSRRSAIPTTHVVTRDAVLAFLEAQTEAVTARQIAEHLCAKVPCPCGEAFRGRANRVLHVLEDEALARVVGQTDHTPTGSPARLWRSTAQRELPTMAAHP